MTGLGESYTCERCGETFTKGWSDEEAMAEARDLFPAEHIATPEDQATVCDGCFREIMAWAETSEPDLLREPAAVSENPIGDALRADAAAAREEIRAAGLICPSCGVNMADLPDGHALAVSLEEPCTVECRDGTAASLAGISSPMDDGAFEKWQAAANIAVWDYFRRREAGSFNQIIGTGPAHFTGLLSALERP